MSPAPAIAGRRRTRPWAVSAAVSRGGGLRWRQQIVVGREGGRETNSPANASERRRGVLNRTGLTVRGSRRGPTASKPMRATTGVSKPHIPTARIIVGLAACDFLLAELRDGPGASPLSWAVRNRHRGRLSDREATPCQSPRQSHRSAVSSWGTNMRAGVCQIIRA
jgi:hypothetical protein